MTSQLGFASDPLALFTLLKIKATVTAPSVTQPTGDTRQSREGGGLVSQKIKDPILFYSQRSIIFKELGRPPAYALNDRSVHCEIVWVMSVSAVAILPFGFDVAFASRLAE